MELLVHPTFSARHFPLFICSLDSKCANSKQIRSFCTCENAICAYFREKGSFLEDFLFLFPLWNRQKWEAKVSVRLDNYQVWEKRVSGREEGGREFAK